MLNHNTIAAWTKGFGSPGLWACSLYAALGLLAWSNLAPVDHNDEYKPPIAGEATFTQPTESIPGDFLSLGLRASAYDGVSLQHFRPVLFAEPPFQNGQFSASVAAPIDYSDPVGRGRVPLRFVAERLEEPLGGGFRVRDFASRDGAPYARISGDLVRGLSRMRAQAGGALFVISGYRHRHYNERAEVGGVPGSYHVAGMAADVWSPNKSSLQLAALALQTYGSSVGLGLGANSLHIDVRGRLATWTYEGAPLTSAQFEVWVRERLGWPVSGEMRRAAEASAPSTPTQPPSPQSDSARVHIAGDQPASRPPTSPGGPSAQEVLRQYRSELAAVARGQSGPGAVVADLRGAPGELDDLTPYLRWVAADDPQAASLGLTALILQAGSGRYAYLVITHAGRHAPGIQALQ
ncbi:hypothetical protein BH23BAC4_BH23BAC4_14330 [soil metagenome]